jgi:hypothetical protein
MKKSLYSICISMLIILLMPLLCIAEEASTPKISFDEKTFDAKEIKGGEYLEHTFKVMNRGSSPLLISDVKPG